MRTLLNQTDLCKLLDTEEPYSHLEQVFERGKCSEVRAIAMQMDSDTFVDFIIHLSGGNKILRYIYGQD